MTGSVPRSYQLSRSVKTVQCIFNIVDIIQHRSVISEWVILTEECSTHGFDKQFPVLCVAVGPVICVVLKLPILRKYK